MAHNINVAIRVRPIIKREEADPIRWKVQARRIFQVDPESGKTIGNSYPFNHIYEDSSTNEEIFKTVVEPIINEAVQGLNGTVLAYGQTSSGKTHTMVGNSSDPGIIPQALQHVVASCQEWLVKREFLIRVSYMEVYNEKIKDLLAPDNTDLKIHEELDGNIKVELREEIANSAEHMLQIMEEGSKNRSIGETNMNEHSSRSHTIFRIVIESKEPDEGEDTGVRISHINLVDLAGSERSSSTGTTGARFKEGCAINKSLLMLGNVIQQLSEDRKQFINYRSSKLTRILQHSLGGNANIAMICAVTPVVAEQTLNTLQFASRARIVKVDPHVNMEMSDAALIKCHARKIKELERELTTAQNIKSKEKELLEINRDLANKLENMKKMLIVSNKPSRDLSDRERQIRRQTWGGPTLKIKVGLGGVHLPSINSDDLIFAQNSLVTETRGSWPDRTSFADINTEIPLLDASSFSSSTSRDTSDRVETCDAECQTTALMPSFLPLVKSEMQQKNVAPGTPPAILRERIQALKFDLDFVEKEHSELREFTTLEKQVLFEPQLAAMREHFEALLQSARDNELMSAELQRSNHILQDEKHELLEQTTRLDNRIKSLQKELDANKTWSTQSSETHLAWKKELDDCRSKLATLQFEKQDWEHEKDILLSRHKDKVGELENFLSEARAEIETLKAREGIFEVKEINFPNLKLEEECDSLREQMFFLEQEIENLRMENDTKQEAQQFNQQEIDKLKEELSLSNRNHLKLDLHLQHKEEAFAKEILMLQNQLKESTNLQSTNVSILKRLSNSMVEESAEKKLEETLADLQSQLRSSEEERQILSEKAIKFEQESNSFASLLNEKDEQFELICAEFSEKIGSLKARCEQLQTENNFLAKKLQSLEEKNQCKVYQFEHDSLTYVGPSSEEEERLRQENEQLRLTNSRLADIHKEEAAYLEDNTSNIEQIQQEILALREGFETNKKKLADDLEVIKENGLLPDLTRHLSGPSPMIEETVANHLEDVEARNSELELQVTSLGDEINCLTDENQHLINQLDKVKQLSVEQAQMCVSLEEQISLMTSKLEKTDITSIEVADYTKKLITEICSMNDDFSPDSLIKLNLTELHQTLMETIQAKTSEIIIINVKHEIKKRLEEKEREIEALCNTREELQALISNLQMQLNQNLSNSEKIFEQKEISETINKNQELESALQQSQHHCEKLEKELSDVKQQIVDENMKRSNSESFSFQPILASPQRESSNIGNRSSQDSLEEAEPVPIISSCHSNNLEFEIQTLEYKNNSLVIGNLSVCVDDQENEINSSYVELQGILESTQQKVRDYEEKMHKIEEQQKKDSDNFKTNLAELTLLRSDLKASEKMLAESLEKVAQISSEKTKLETALQEYSDQISKLNKRNDELQLDLGKLSVVSEEFNEIRKREVEVALEKIKLEAALEESLKQITKLNEEMCEIKLNSSNLSGVEKQLQEIEVQRAQLLDEKVKLEENFKNSLEQISQLSDKLVDFDMMQNDILFYKEQQVKIQDRLAQISYEKADLENLLQNYSDQITELNMKNHELELNQANISGVKKELCEIQDIEVEVSTDKANIKAALQESLKQISDMNKEICELKFKLSNLSGVEEQLQEIREQRAQLLEEKTNLEEEFKKSLEQTSQLSEKMLEFELIQSNSLIYEKRQLENQEMIAQVSVEKTKLETTLKEYSDHISELNKRNNNLQTDLENLSVLKEELHEIHEREVTANLEKIKLEVALEESLKQISELNEEMRQLKVKLNNLTDLEQHLQEIQEQKARLLEEKIELEDEFQKSLYHVSQLNDKMVEFEVMQSEFLINKKQLVEIQGRLTQVFFEKTEVENLLQVYSNQISELNTKNHELELDLGILSDVKERLGEIQEREALVSAEKIKLELAFKESTEQVSELNNKIIELELDQNNLMKQLQENEALASTKISDLQATLLESAKAQSNLLQEVNILKEQNNRALLNSKQLSELETEASHKAASKEEALQITRQKNQELLHELSVCKQALESVTEKLNEAKKEFAVFQERERQYVDTITSLQSSEEKWKAQAKKSEQAQIFDKQRYESLESKHSSVKEELMEQQNITEKYREKLYGIEDLLSKNTSEMKELQHRESLHKQSYQNLKAELENQEHKSKMEITLLEQQLNCAALEAEKVSRLQEELSSLKSLYDEDLKKLHSLRLVDATCRELEDKLKKEMQAMQDLKNNMERDSETVTSDLKSKLNEMHSNYRELEAKYSQLQEENQVCNNTVQIAERNVSVLKIELQKKDLILAEYEEKFQLTQNSGSKKVQALELEVQELKSYCINLKTNAEKLQIQLEQQQGELTYLKDQITTKNTLLNKVQSQKDGICQELILAETQISELVETLNEKEEEFKDLMKTYHETLNMNRRFKEESMKVLAESKKISPEANESVSNLEQALKEKQSALEDTISQLKELKESNDNVENRLKSMRIELADARGELANLKLNDLPNKIESEKWQKRAEQLEERIRLQSIEMRNLRSTQLNMSMQDSYRHRSVQLKDQAVQATSVNTVSVAVQAPPDDETLFSAGGFFPSSAITEAGRMYGMRDKIKELEKDNRMLKRAAKSRLEKLQCFRKKLGLPIDGSADKENLQSVLNLSSEVLPPQDKKSFV